MQAKAKKLYKDLTRIDKHKDYLWKRIYELRCEITDFVLTNTINDQALPYRPATYWEALKVKANLVRKYSHKLRQFDTIRWNETVPERI